MEINFATCTIERLIIHEVFKKIPGDKNGAGSKPSLTLVSFDIGVQSLLKKRLNTAFGKESNSFSVAIKDDATNSFFKKSIACKDSDDATFISCTSDMCTKLANDLPYQTSGGYLIVIQGNHLGRFFLAAIKADKTEALQSSGTSLQVLRDIFLSPSAKFFKIGLISQLQHATDFSSSSSYESILFDEQFRTGSSLAKFFSDDFCGFNVSDNAKIKTQDYWLDCLKSITRNFTGSNYEEGIRIKDQLINDVMHNNSIVISPENFANTSLQSPYREIFLDEIVTLYPETFIKDSILLKGSLTKKNLFFDEIKLTGPSDSFNNSIEIINTASELASLQIGGDVGYTIVRIKGCPSIVKDNKALAHCSYERG